MIKPKYVLLDPYDRFFSSFTGYIPAIIHDFTNDERYACKFDSLEEAESHRKKLLDRLYIYDGNERVNPLYLRIAEITFTIFKPHV